MSFVNSIYNLLNRKEVFLVLLIINILIGIIIFSISSSLYFPDAIGYILMGEGIIEGKFSSWYSLPKFYPETLRTPGYPVFLALCSLIYKSQLFVKVVQLFLYFVSIFLCTKIIKYIDDKYVYRSFFLFLLIPNIQIVYYTGFIGSETLTVFFLVLAMYFVFTKRTLPMAILLSLVCYCLSMVKPVFVLLPIMLFVVFIIQSKKAFVFSSLFLFVYLLLLIPFGIWNLNNHGTFKVTSIEGGAGVAHMGFWQLKLPDGYSEKFYWGNNTGYDYTRPKYYTLNELEQNTNEFEKEWRNVLVDLKKYETDVDLFYLKQMAQNNPGTFILHNSAYTLEREKALWKLVMKNIKEEPMYYFNSRIYHLFRFYVTGINYKQLENSSSLLSKINIIYPFLVTLFFIFFGIIFIVVVWIFKKVKFQNLGLFVALFLYVGVLHIPFAIQARYTVPVHLLILSVLSISIIKSIKLQHE